MYYAVTVIDSRGHEYEFDSYKGFDFCEMLKVVLDFRKNDDCALVLREYNLPKGINQDNEDEIANAIIECDSYAVLNNNDINVVKILRKATGMSQNEFARYFEMPAGTLRNWEQGIRECPKYLIKLMAFKLQTNKRI